MGSHSAHSAPHATAGDRRQPETFRSAALGSALGEPDLAAEKQPQGE